MKKLISALMALALVLCIAAPTTAMADTEGQLWVDQWDLVYSENLNDGYQQGGDYDYQGHGVLGLKPADKSMPGKIFFYVDVDKAGLYKFTIIYGAKKSTPRNAELYVNGEFASDLEFTLMPDWKAAEHIVYVTLEKGENEVLFTSPADFDGSSVKTPNIWGFKYKLTQASEVVEPTPEPTVEPTPAPTEAPVVTPEPTVAPTAAPTAAPTVAPTTAPTEAPKPTTAPVIEGTEYVIKAGDTLSAIAAACGATVKELVEANKIENPDVIITGAKLVIPTFEVKRHIVKKGDTLSAIAKANNCKLDDILKVNTIENPDVIIIGDVIVLP